MQKVEKPFLARSIIDFVLNATAICEEAGQVVFDGGSIFHLFCERKASGTRIGDLSKPSISGVLVLFLMATQMR